jgi:uncharacterized membrane protein
MITNCEQIRWIFKKNCSFTPKQVGLFYLAQSFFSLMIASFFLLQGIWLVLPFTLLELVVLAIALLIYARHATDFEEIVLENGLLQVRTSNANQVNIFQANAAWVKLSNQLTSSKLIGIQYQGNVKEIGKFIHLQKREAFKKQLERSLRTMSLKR